MIYIKSFTFNTVQENTYILYTEAGHAAIVDCGAMSQGEYRAITDFVDQHGLRPVLLLNTHLHFDHAWGNAWALRTYPELVAYAHHKELTDQPKPSEQVALFGLSVPYEDLAPEQYLPLEQGQVIRLGEEDLEVRCVPGHSPGHVVFYSASSSCVIAGDTLFCEDIGRTDLWGGSYDQLVEGIRTQMLTLPEDTVVYTGHGDPTTIGHEKRYNSYVR